MSRYVKLATTSLINGVRMFRNPPTPWGRFEYLWCRLFHRLTPHTPPSGYGISYKCTCKKWHFFRNHAEMEERVTVLQRVAQTATDGEEFSRNQQNRLRGVLHTTQDNLRRQKAELRRELPGLITEALWSLPADPAERQAAAEARAKDLTATIIGMLEP